MREWEADAGDYVGCSFIGGEMYDRPRHRFFEPLSFIFGKREYYLFFSGGAVPCLAVPLSYSTARCHKCQGL